jgi:uncharacterized membrane protein YsdA (DUF1294 family)
MIHSEKRRAERHRSRIVERTLYLLEFLGGFPGSLWAMHRYRHKTHKLHYLAAKACMIVLHLAAITAAAFTFLR